MPTVGTVRHEEWQDAIPPEPMDVYREQFAM